MRISADVLYGLLSEKYRLNRFGKGARVKDFSLPTFYEPNVKIVPGGIYIARTLDLPNKPPEDCIIICCGTKPPLVWNMWPCEIIHIMDVHDDLISVFNTIQRLIDSLMSWESTMQGLVASGAHVREMVEVSIPIFESRITVTDYELRVLAHCTLDQEHPELGVQMSDRYGHIPTEKMPFISNSRAGLMRNREPFFAKEPDGSDSYCINLFLGDTYIGTCSLMAEQRELRPLDLELFQLFSEFIRDVLTIQSRSMGNQLVTARTVFDQLLHGFPVSHSDMEHALNLIELNLSGRKLADHKWCCIVLQNEHRGRNIPEEYLFATLENILPTTTTLVVDNTVAAFCLMGEEEHRVEEICDPLDAYLKDMGFKAGVSRTFCDPFHAQSFYRQAMCALETGLELEPDRQWYLFGDHVLDYMLQNCCGDFDSELIVAPELVRLYNHSATGPDYVDTLRNYLDNDCNASKTAKVMFLHRSTLVQRLGKIREYVDLDSPDRCLYLRMCLHLTDIDCALANNRDV